MDKTGQAIKKYAYNVLISIDQLVNTLAGGDPDETISSRVGKHYKGTWLAKLIDWMFSWQDRPGGHCSNAAWWESDEGKDAIEYFLNKYNDI